MNKEEWEDYKNLSSQITEKLDNTSTYESWLIIQEYIDRCQQENQKYKEVFDKAIEYINENWGHWCSNHCKYATETIEILKGSGINEIRSRNVLLQ